MTLRAGERQTAVEKETGERGAPGDNAPDNALVEELTATGTTTHPTRKAVMVSRAIQRKPATCIAAS